jgi:hypothetical protein
MQHDTFFNNARIGEETAPRRAEHNNRHGPTLRCATYNTKRPIRLRKHRSLTVLQEEGNKRKHTLVNSTENLTSQIMDVEGMANDIPECSLVTKNTQGNPKQRGDHLPRAHTPLGLEVSPHRSPPEKYKRQCVTYMKAPPTGDGERTEKRETKNTDMDTETGACNAPTSSKRTKKLKTGERHSALERTRSKTCFTTLT